MFMLLDELRAQKGVIAALGSQDGARLPQWHGF